MAKYRLAPDERETTINYNDIDDFAIITTHNAKLSKELIANKCEQVFCDEAFYPTLYQFRVPLTWVSVIPPKPRRSRIMTDAQREAAAERMRQMHAKNKAMNA